MSEVTGHASSSGNKNLVAYGIGAVVGIVIGALGATFLSGGGSSADPVVAKFNGQSVKESDAFKNIKTRLADLSEELYRTKEQAINEHIEQRLLENEAKKQNMTVEALLAKEAGGATAEVADAEIEAFLSTKGLSLKDPRIKKDEVREYLKYRQSFEKRQGYVAKLRASADVKLLVKEPEAAKLTASIEGYPTWGNPKAPVTIIEFSDYQCPFCSRAVPVLDRIKAEYGPDKVKIVFRDMPLPNHNRATPAALAAHCAGDQGKYWEMHNALFQNQTKLEDADLKTYAKSLGIEEAKFTECYNQKKHQALVDKSRREAESLGIQATPSFIINGQLLQGAQPFERFKEKIDRALKG